MGNIREYTSDVNGLQPQEFGARVTAQLAAEQERSWNAIGTVAGQATEAVGKAGLQYAEFKDASAISAKSTQAMLAGTKALNDYTANADPNDPEAAQKFLKEHIEPITNAIAGTAFTERGRQIAQARAEALTNHFTSAIQSDMAIKAGEQVKNEALQSANMLSNNANLDPSSTQAALAAWNAHMDIAVQAPNLSAEARARLEDFRQQQSQNIVKAGVQGLTMKNPAEGVKMAQRPEFAKFISGVELKQMETYAKSVFKQNEAADRVAANAKKTEAVNATSQAVNKLESETITFDKDGTPQMANPHEALQTLNGMLARSQSNEEGNVVRAAINRIVGLEKPKNALGDGETFADVLKTGIAQPTSIRQASIDAWNDKALNPDQSKTLHEFERDVAGNNGIVPPKWSAISQAIDIVRPSIMPQGVSVSPNPGAAAAWSDKQMEIVAAVKEAQANGVAQKDWATYAAQRVTGKVNLQGYLAAAAAEEQKQKILREKPGLGTTLFRSIITGKTFDETKAAVDQETKAKLSGVPIAKTVEDLDARAKELTK